VVKIQDENKELEMDIQSKKKMLMRKQQYELQNQQVKEMLEIVKSQEDKEKIQELEAEQEMLQDMVEALSKKERTANDELEDARKAANEVRVLSFLNYKDVRNCILRPEHLKHLRHLRHSHNLLFWVRLSIGQSKVHKICYKCIKHKF